MGHLNIKRKVIFLLLLVILLYGNGTNAMVTESAPIPTVKVLENNESIINKNYDLQQNSESFNLIGSYLSPSSAIQGIKTIEDITGDNIPEVSIITEGGNIFVYDGETGELVWLQHMDFSIISFDVADANADSFQEIVIIGSNNIVLLNSTNGDILWSHGDEQRNFVYVQFFDTENDGNAQNIAVISEVGDTGEIITYDISGTLLWNLHYPIMILIWPTIRMSEKFVVADFNHDGINDICTGSITVNGSNGTIIWNPWSTDSYYFMHLETIDVTKDGTLDVISLYYNISSGGMLGIFDGTNGSLIYSESGFGSYDYIATGNFDLDSNLEFAVSSWSGSSIKLYDDDGSFMRSYDIYLQTTCLYVIDINNNGIDDLIVCGFYGEFKVINGGIDSTIWETEINKMDTAYKMSSYRDEDNNIRICVATASMDANVFVFDSSGEIIWDTTSAGSNICDIKYGELTGDNQKDIVVLLSHQIVAIDSSDNSILWTFDAPAPYYIFDLSIGDANGDGIDDILSHSYNCLYLIDGQNGNLIWSKYTPFNIDAILLGDTNNDGFADVICSASYSKSLEIYNGINGSLIWSGEGSVDMRSSTQLLLANISLDSYPEIIRYFTLGVEVIDYHANSVLFTRDYSGGTNSLLDIEAGDFVGTTEEDLIISTKEFVEMVDGRGVIAWQQAININHFVLADTNGDAKPEITNGITSLNITNGEILHSLSLSGTPDIDPLVVNVSSDALPDFLIIIGNTIYKILSPYDDFIVVLTLPLHPIQWAVDTSGNLEQFILTYGRALIPYDVDSHGIKITAKTEYEKGGVFLSWKTFGATVGSYTIRANFTVIKEGTYRYVGIDTISVYIPKFTGELEVWLSLSDSINGYPDYMIDLIDWFFDNTPPTVSGPEDMTITDKDISTATIAWTANDEYPGDYKLYINGTVYQSGNWTSEEQILIKLSDYPLTGGETYNFTIVVFDIANNTASDTVMVTIIETVPEFASMSVIEGITLISTALVTVLLTKKKKKA